MALFSTGPAPEHSIAALLQPYTWLTWLPGYSGVRVPARFFMLAVLCLAVAAGLALDALRARFSRGRRLLVVLAFAGLACDGAIAGMPLGVPPPRLNLDEPGAHVLVLPFEDGRASVAAMYQSMATRLPVVNGYSGYIPSHADVIEWALHRADPSVLTELRRGHPLYVVVAPGEGEDRWTAFMERQPEAHMLGVQGSGRIYRLPAAPNGREARAGTPIDNVGLSADPGWLIADFHAPRPVRGLELRTYGVLHPLPDELVVQTSDDGRDWTTVYDDRTGGVALAGALARPQVVPLRLDLSDVVARYVRLDTPAFSDCVFFGP